MTNPLVGLTPADLVGGPSPRRDEMVTLFPPSTSRETELYEKLFPRGLPANADLMRELIGAIRSGKVDLKPPAKTAAGTTIKSTRWRPCSCREGGGGEQAVADEGV